MFWVVEAEEGLRIGVKAEDEICFLYRRSSDTKIHNAEFICGEYHFSSALLLLFIFIKLGTPDEENVDWHIPQSP